MKKMIVAAVAITLAVVANASSAYWTCSNVFLGNETDKCGGLAYFVVTDTITSSALQALGASGSDAIVTALGSSYNFEPASAGSYVKTAANAVSVGSLGLADETSYTGYLVIFDGSTVADSTKFYTTQEMDFTTLSGENAVQIKFGSQKNDSVVAGNWTAIASASVPEPTSGLLMLVGLAGLALRRRRA